MTETVALQEHLIKPGHEEEPTALVAVEVADLKAEVVVRIAMDLTR